jgi:hypothetical protein
MKVGFGVTCVMFLALLAQHAGAAEPQKATTDELPAALRALTPDAGRILTVVEAGQIRGEGGMVAWNGYMVSKNFGVQVIDGVTYLSAKNVSIGSRNKIDGPVGPDANFGLQNAGGDIVITAKKVEIGSHNKFKGPVDPSVNFGIQNVAGNVSIVAKKITIGSHNKFSYKGH